MPNQQTLLPGDNYLIIIITSDSSSSTDDPHQLGRSGNQDGDAKRAEQLHCISMA